MQLTVNGKRVAIEHEMTIAAFLSAKGLNEALVAVEHNALWLRREDWAHTVLSENDRLEIVHLIAGGGKDERLR